MSLEDELKALRAKPCSCVMCDSCHGFGSDDDDNCTECMWCVGGIVEFCDNCEQAAELELMLDEQR